MASGDQNEERAGRVLSRASLEAYGGLLLAIVIVVLPYWYVQIPFLLVAAGLVADLGLHAPLMQRCAFATRRLLSATAALVIVCGGGFAVFAQHRDELWSAPHGSLTQPSSPETKSIHPKDAISLPPPDLLSLFLSDLKPAVGPTWNAVTDISIGANEQKIRVYYKIVADIQARTKYIAFYIPYIGRNALFVISYLSKTYRQLEEDIESNHWAVGGMVGDSNVANTKELLFSGTVYIYHDDPINAEQTGDFTRQFKEAGANVIFRGDAYATSAWMSIRAGDAKSPPKFVIKDGLPVRVD